MSHLHATQKDIEEAEAQLDTMPTERALKVGPQLTGLANEQILKNVHLMHKHDQNFDIEILHRIEQFITDPEIQTNPDKHAGLIHAMRIEALLVTNNSPYAMVRGVVDVADDPEMPSLTIRVWILGILACGVGSVINQLFSIRYPSILLDSSTIQLLACKSNIISATDFQQTLLDASSLAFYRTGLSMCLVAALASILDLSTERNTCWSPL